MHGLRLVGVIAVLAACGGGNGGGGGTPPPPAAVSTVAIQPTAGQSINVNATVGFTALPRDAQGNTLSGRTVTWSSSDQTKVTVSPATGTSTSSGVSTTATGVAAGSSSIRATSEGQQSSAVTVTVTQAGPNPSTADVTATTSNTFSPSTVTIAPGGTVTWTFASTHNVTFGTNKPTGGDIGDTPTGTVSRTFPTAGGYSYTCTLHAGMNGTVNVQ